MTAHDIGGPGSTPANPGGGPGSTPANPGGGPGSTPANPGAGVTAPSTRCAPAGGPASTPASSDRSQTKETLPSRKRPAHPPVVESFNRSILVFLTVCTKDKTPVLACDQMHDWLRQAWTMATHWKVGRYVVMPDHIHLFCAPGTYPPTPVEKWTEYWKGMLARAVKGHGPLIGGPGSTPAHAPDAERGRGGTRPSHNLPPSIWPDPLWQQACWDTQLRRGDSYAEKWDYVRHNPVRAGLCSMPES
jgi:putative transposase